jgi:hypothetical protein
VLHLGPIAIGDAGSFALASPPARGSTQRFASASEALAFLRREVTHPQLRQIRRMLAHDGAFGREDDEAILRRLAEEVARHRVIVLRRASDEGRPGASTRAAPPIVTDVPAEPLAAEPLTPADDITVRATIEADGAPWIVAAEIDIDDQERREALAAEETSE